MVFHTPEVFGKRLGDVQYRNPLPHMSIEAVCIALLTHAKFSLRHLDIELLENGSMCGCHHEPFLEPYRPYVDKPNRTADNKLEMERIHPARAAHP